MNEVYSFHIRKPPPSATASALGHLMSQEPKKKASLHDLSREIPPIDEVSALVTSLVDMEARAAALIMASILDNFLESAISACFVKLSSTKFNTLFRDRQAPFSSFSNKISVAHALGVYDDSTRAQLDSIRSIRNAFAHTMQPIDFDHPVVATACNNLNPSAISGKSFTAHTPREKFIGTATLIGIVIVSFTRDRAIAVRAGEHSPPVAYVCKFESRPLPEIQNQD
jgi:hypothetical protein